MDRFSHLPLIRRPDPCPRGSRHRPGIARVLPRAERCPASPRPGPAGLSAGLSLLCAPGRRARLPKSLAE